MTMAGRGAEVGAKRFRSSRRRAGCPAVMGHGNASEGGSAAPVVRSVSRGQRGSRAGPGGRWAGLLPIRSQMAFREKVDFHMFSFCSTLSAPVIRKNRAFGMGRFWTVRNFHLLLVEGEIAQRFRGGGICQNCDVFARKPLSPSASSGAHFGNRSRRFAFRKQGSARPLLSTSCLSWRKSISWRSMVRNTEQTFVAAFSKTQREPVSQFARVSFIHFGMWNAITNSHGI